MRPLPEYTKARFIRKVASVEMHMSASSSFPRIVELSHNKLSRTATFKLGLDKNPNPYQLIYDKSLIEQDDPIAVG